MMNLPLARAKVSVADELFQLTKFGWTVAAGGYCLTKGRELQAPRPGFFLVERSPQSEVLDAPMHDGLFREFSDLLPGSEPILAFANKYGRLGKYALLNPTKREPGESALRAVQTGESLEVWLSEIAQRDVQAGTNLGFNLR